MDLGESTWSTAAKQEVALSEKSKLLFPIRTPLMLVVSVEIKIRCKLELLQYFFFFKASILEQVSNEIWA